MAFLAYGQISHDTFEAMETLTSWCRWPCELGGGLVTRGFEETFSSSQLPFKSNTSTIAVTISFSFYLPQRCNRHDIKLDAYIFIYLFRTPQYILLDEKIHIEQHFYLITFVSTYISRHTGTGKYTEGRSPKGSQ